MSLIKIKYFIFLTFFIMVSCQNNTEQGVIPKDKMVDMLIDMHIYEEAINELPYEKDTLKSLFKMKELEIFESYSVTEEMYRKSYSHYFFNPKELDNIYQVVIDSLSVYQQTKGND